MSAVDSTPRSRVRANALVLSAVMDAVNREMPTSARLTGIAVNPDTGEWGGDLQIGSRDNYGPILLVGFPTAQALVARVLDIVASDARVAERAARTVH